MLTSISACLTLALGGSVSPASGDLFRLIGDASVSARPYPSKGVAGTRRTNSGDHSSMRCRIAAATRVASLNVTDHCGFPKRNRRTHHALVKDLDEFVSSRSCCLIFDLLSRHQRNTRLAVFIGAAGWRVNRVRSPRNILITRDLCCPHFGL